MPHRNTELFPEYQVVRDRLAKAKKILDRLATGTGPCSYEDRKVYHELVQLRDASFPLLLRSGDPVPMDTDPAHFYLLPPIPDRPDERWLLCQAPTRVGLLRWRWEEQRDFLEPMEAWKNGGHVVDDVPEDLLSWRALTLELPTAFPGLVVILLRFPGGDLQLISGPEGIHTHHWQAVSPARGPERSERRSSGDMEPILSCIPHTDDRWRDDDLELRDGTRIDGGRHVLGHIHGADSPSRKPELVYAAGDNGRIHRFRQGRNSPESSHYLGGVIEDVLITGHPERDDGYAILAAVADGRIYLLDDQDGEDDISRLYYQFTGQGMVRLLGFGDRRIIARDRHFRLFPLRLHHPEKFTRLRDDLTRCLWGKLGLNDSAHRLWSEPEGELHERLKENGYPVAAMARLLLEHHLLCARDSGGDSDRHESKLQRLIRAFKQGYDEDDAVGAESRGRVHEELLARVWRWIATSREARLRPIRSIEAVQVLLELADLPESAPDWLWLRLFRHAEWLDHLPGLVDEPLETDDLEPRIRQIRESIARQRKSLAPAMFDCRPLRVSGGARTTGYIRHLRHWGKTDAILFIAHGRELVAMETAGRPGVAWKETGRLIPETPSQSHWLGMPTSLIACEDLASLTQKPGALLLATNRGELRLIQQAEGRLKIVDRRNVPMDVRCAWVIRDCGGLVLGGRSQTNRPVLMWLPFGRVHAEPRVLWQGEPGAHLRKMAIRERGQDEVWIWAIERERGRLLHWRWKKEWIKSSTALSLPECWHDSPGQLYTLAVRAGQLVTGGSDGIAFAFDERSGAPLWTAGCGSTLRRSIHLRAEESSADGYWLLGGDHEHVLMVDRAGRPLGAAEYFGPVTTIVDFDQDEALLGGLDGRISLLDSTRPETPAGQHAGEWKDPARYPLREQAYLEVLTPDELLDLIRSPHSEATESLPLISVYAALLEELRESEERRRTSYWPAFRDHLTGVAAPRLVWVMRRLVEWDGPAAREYLLDLGDAYWRYIGQLADRSNLCQPLNHLLAYLEGLLLAPASDRDHKDQDAVEELLDKMLSCIWEERDCPEGLCQGRRLAGLRMSQVLRIWRRTDPARPVLERLHEWLNHLYLVWGQPEADTISERLRRVLPDIPALLTQKDAGWWDWFKAVVTSDADVGPPASLRSLLPEERFPKPSPEGFIEARELLPDNEAWAEWLGRLDQALSRLEDARRKSPRLLWFERDCLLDIQRLTTEQGESRFSLENAQVLLSLWRAQLRNHWGPLLKAAFAELRQWAESDPMRFIDIEMQRQSWSDGNHVMLRLKLRNRLPNTLRLDRVRWRPIQHVDAGAGEQSRALATAVTLPACNDWNPTELPVLKIERKECGMLILDCINQHTGARVELRKRLELERRLGRFDQDAQWRPTWERLEQLLKQRGHNEKGRLVWINGDQLGPDEYRRLSDTVLDLFGVSPDDTFAVYKSPGEAIEHWDGKQTLFSPDLALGAPADKLLEQLHALIHHMGGGRFQFFALSLWHLSRPLPDTVHDALRNVLTDQERLKAFLRMLLPGKGDDLKEAQANLPQRALGAWCMGDPVYPSLPAWAEEEEVYAPAAMGLSWELWQKLDDAKVATAEIADMLGLEAPVAQTQRRRRELLRRIWASDQIMEESLRGEIAGMLFRSLGGIDPARGLSPPSSRVEKLSILHQRFERLYFHDGQGLANPSELEAGLWIYLRNEKEPTPGLDLPGRALGLDPEQTLSLLHAGGTRPARALLNRIAAEQWGISPRRVFQSEAGMTEEALEYHFAGRKKELEDLHALLCQGTNPEESKGAVLLTGGRRIGKTSLRQRFAWELRRKQDPRAIVVLDLQDLPSRDRDSRVQLQFDFMRRLYTALEQAGHGVPYAQRWHPRDKGSEYQAEEAFGRLENHYRAVKKHHENHAPLLVLDETEKLIARDSRLDYPILRHLRRLCGDGILYLVVTSYPHGMGAQGALNVQLRQSGTPAFNFLSEIVISRWPPDEGWEYLRDKLSGFGIVLPLSLRNAVIMLTQGVPSIVHALGQIICDRAGTGKRHLVTPALWREIADKLRTDLTGTLKSSVARVADECVAEQRTDFRHDPAHPLDHDRLWTALLDLGSKKEIVPPRPDGEWPELQSLSIKELSRQFGGEVSDGQLRTLLDRLTSTHVLEGDPTDKDKFFFANDLIPSLAHPMEDS